MERTHSSRPGLRGDLKEIVRELAEYRELLYSMTWRDLLLRYKQSVMGFGWAVLFPVMNMIIFSVIFMRVARLDTPVPYPVYAYAGLLVWNFFAASLKFAALSLTGNMILVTKVYFPREVFPLSAMLVCLVDFFVASLLLVPLMFYYGITPSWSLLFVPVVLVVVVAFTAGASLLLAMANLFYRDVKYLFEIILTVWMFATSVVYPVERIGGTLGTVLALNPMTPLVEGFRSAVLLGRLPPLGPFLYATAFSFVVLVSGWLAFHRAEFRFAESV